MPPPLPNNIGKQRMLTDIDGKKQGFTVIDEIRRPQSDNDNNAIYLQRIQFQRDGSTELRLAYYMIGKKPRMLGKWAWGQYATILPMKDFQAIIREAEKKDWI